jgi:hypothetical protein
MPHAFRISVYSGKAAKSMVIYGGKNRDGVSLNDIQFLNLTNYTWQRVTSGKDQDIVPRTMHQVRSGNADDLLLQHAVYLRRLQ